MFCVNVLIVRALCLGGAINTSDFCGVLFDLAVFETVLFCTVTAGLFMRASICTVSQSTALKTPGDQNVVTCLDDKPLYAESVIVEKELT